MEQDKKQALLVMDVQAGIVDRIENKEAYLAAAEQTIDWARSKHIPIFYVVVGFRPGTPEVSARNKMFSAIKESGAQGMINPTPVLTPAENEPVITKRRVSAFSGSDLEVLLRAHGITHLVLGGIATSGVVLSTVREAADKDYGLTVLSDLCADFDPGVNETLLTKVFPRQAEVMESTDWMQT